MKLLRASLLLAALLLSATSTFATSAAPGVYVKVRSGKAVAFEGLTDSRGRFETGPLQPGLYTFELRVPKNIITPAQYFLVLGGARPMTDATSAPGLALTMDAEVRSPRSVRGQVTARRVNIVPAQTTAATTTPATSTTTRAITPAAPPVADARPPITRPAAAPAGGAPPAPASPGMSSFAPRPMNNAPRMINGRAHVWVPITAGANVGRWVPASAPRR